jgi:4-methyl-5(b-hydroxyethyl)-thiazole monophosphate biosynthesis
MLVRAAEGVYHILASPGGIRRKGSSAMPRVLVPLADGVEEMEAVIIIDVLRRASIEVTAASVMPALAVKASRGVVIVADASWPDAVPGTFDAIAIPGGAAGTEKLLFDRRVISAVRGFAEAGRVTGAVCAAPLVLQAAGILKGKRATCHPAVRGRLTDAVYVEERVVTDGLVVTSRGPGTSMEFALELVSILAGTPAAGTVAGGLILPSGSVVPR